MTKTSNKTDKNVTVLSDETALPSTYRDCNCYNSKSFNGLSRMFPVSISYELAKMLLSENKKKTGFVSFESIAHKMVKDCKIVDCSHTKEISKEQLEIYHTTPDLILSDERLMTLAVNATATRIKSHFKTYLNGDKSKKILPRDPESFVSGCKVSETGIEITKDFQPNWIIMSAIVKKFSLKAPRMGFVSKKAAPEAAPVVKAPEAAPEAEPKAAKAEQPKAAETLKAEIVVKTKKKAILRKKTA